MLSANEWPKFKYKNIELPEAMTSIVTAFEEDFNKSPENASK